MGTPYRRYRSKSERSYSHDISFVRKAYAKTLCTKRADIQRVDIIFYSVWFLFWYYNENVQIICIHIRIILHSCSYQTWHLAFSFISSVDCYFSKMVHEQTNAESGLFTFSTNREIVYNYRSYSFGHRFRIRIQSQCKSLSPNCSNTWTFAWTAFEVSKNTQPHFMHNCYVWVTFTVDRIPR